MVVEVTSVPDRRRTVSAKGLVRLGIILAMVVSAIAADALVRSYTYYSQLIDPRLASVYLTSRPGLYAVPRVLQAGQKLSAARLVTILRRAGYVEAKASDVWSGSFIVDSSTIEIRPARKTPEVVRVIFAGDEIAEIRGDGVLLESFSLEPEI